jgi:hypothetical protein
MPPSGSRQLTQALPVTIEKMVWRIARAALLLMPLAAR